MPSEDSADAEDEAVVGAGTGAVVGALAGLLAVTIPGVGPALALGPLAAILGGAGVGAAAGGLVGALAGAGLSDEEAYCYEEGVRRGGTLVAVTAEDEDDGDAIAVLNRYGPVDLRTRGDEWRQDGWTPRPATPAGGSLRDTAADAARNYGSA
jgi:hypothetical protein